MTETAETSEAADAAVEPRKHRLTPDQLAAKSEADAAYHKMMAEIAKDEREAATTFKAAKAANNDRKRVAREARAKAYAEAEIETPAKAAAGESPATASEPAVDPTASPTGSEGIDDLVFAS